MLFNFLFNKGPRGGRGDDGETGPDGHQVYTT